MSDVRLSGATKALLKAAKADAPSAATRAKVWAGVSGAIGGAAGAAGSAGAATGAASGLATGATVGGMSVAKMLVIGTLLGGAVTVGLAAVALRVGPSPSEVHPAAAIAVQAQAASQNPMPVATATATATTTTTPTPTPTPTATATSKPIAQRAHASPEDALAREASLVSNARKALSRGDARAALALVRQARALPSPPLVPEEHAVASQALRALGNADEATGVDFTLKTQYPDSALAR